MKLALGLALAPPPVRRRLYRVEQLDGSEPPWPGGEQAPLFATREVAWQAALSFRLDARSRCRRGVRAWLRVVQVIA